MGGKMATWIMNQMHTVMYDAMIKNMPNTGKILEVGVGNGVVMERALKRSGAEFYGIDISKDMVKTAAKRNRKAIREGRLTLAEGSVDAIPFAEGFDLIYTTNTVYFWKDLDAGLREIKNKLSPGGMFMNVLYTKEYLDKISYTRWGFSKYTPDELIRAAEENGFTASAETIQEGRSFVVKAFKCMDVPNKETIEAIEEVKAMKKDHSLSKRYTDVDEMMRELLSDSDC